MLGVLRLAAALHIGTSRRNVGQQVQLIACESWQEQNKHRDNTTGRAVTVEVGRCQELADISPDAFLIHYGFNFNLLSKLPSQRS